MRCSPGPGLVVAPGVFDGFSARAVELSGYSAAYVTGAGSSLSNFGLPDLGLITQSDMVDQIFRLGEATTLPLIVDGDTGFGSVANVVRTVRRYERAGAAAIQLEDQVFPKRCGHLDGKEVLDVRAVRSRASPPPATRVSTIDSRSSPAPTRSSRSGSTPRWIEPTGTPRPAQISCSWRPRQDLQHVERIASEVTAPKMINMISASVTPMLTFEQLERYGFALAIYPDGHDGECDGRDDARVAGPTRGPRRPIRRTPPDTPELFELFDLAGWRDIADRDI